MDTLPYGTPPRWWAPRLNRFWMRVIRPVRVMLRTRRQERVRESHPELIFQRLNGDAPLPSKKTYDGIRLRRRILLDMGFASIDAWLFFFGHGCLPVAQ